MYNLLPEGYEITTKGDFYVNKNGETKLEVNVEKVNKNVTMSIRFMDGDTFVAGGDYTLTKGAHNYSELSKYVPEGYEMTVSGDFTAVEGSKLDVNVEKVSKNVTMNIRFMDGDTFVAGGDYTLTKGAHNYSELSKYVPEGYEMTVSGDFTAAEGLKLDVNIKKSSSDVVMNVVFKYNGEVIKGGDYFLPKGVQNYSILEDLVPEGYVMSESGDFTVVENGFITINLDRVDKNIIMNVVFRDGDIAIAGGDYTLLEGIHNYTDLAQYVPEGYEMTVSGDFYAREGSNLIVNVAKKDKPCIMNVRFMDRDKFVAGGDYTLLEGINSYSVLSQYVPEGYKMTVSGDFMATEGGHLDVSIEKIKKEVTMNIRFMDGKEFVAGGDYTLIEGVHNYSELSQYVPEGYKMTVSGDFTAADGEQLDINIEKVKKEVTMNIRFMDGKEFVAGGDYKLKEGVHNYSELSQYVPEGYRMTVSGDFYATEGGKLEVSIEKIPATKNEAKLVIKVVDLDTKKELSNTLFISNEKGTQGEYYTFVQGTDFEVKLPKGYRLAKGVSELGDIQVEYGTTTTATVYAQKDALNGSVDTHKEDASKENPDKAEPKKDSEKSGKTQTSLATGLFGSFAGISASSAAIMALLRRKRNKR